VNEVVKLERHDAVAVVTVNSPPVNALSAAVRGGMLDGIRRAIASVSVSPLTLPTSDLVYI